MLGSLQSLAELPVLAAASFMRFKLSVKSAAAEGELLPPPRPRLSLSRFIVRMEEEGWKEL